MNELLPFSLCLEHCSDLHLLSQFIEHKTQYSAFRSINVILRYDKKMFTEQLNLVRCEQYGIKANCFSASSISTMAFVKQEVVLDESRDSVISFEEAEDVYVINGQRAETSVTTFTVERLFDEFDRVQRSMKNPAS